ncbi:uncharacterized protein KY384_007492 [Bacidia gigantensis]|uniref:uncharacterized protein n=1 Tax=Bacidia gigantensis TaxID=2732470 RepID=UPI001D050E9B|nr:uncharacterized protein KY384_007492 [Bacidia gigantensis]KAG8527340.1 hypothetical protein KY384_007492 [Bacidia gigantensis]
MDLLPQLRPKKSAPVNSYIDAVTERIINNIGRAPIFAWRDKVVVRYRELFAAKSEEAVKKGVVIVGEFCGKGSQRGVAIAELSKFSGCCWCEGGREGGEWMRDELFRDIEDRGEDLSCGEGYVDGDSLLGRAMLTRFVLGGFFTREINLKNEKDTRKGIERSIMEVFVGCPFAATIAGLYIKQTPTIDKKTSGKAKKVKCTTAEGIFWKSVPPSLHPQFHNDPKFWFKSEAE